MLAVFVAVSITIYGKVSWRQRCFPFNSSTFLCISSFSSVINRGSLLDSVSLDEFVGTVRACDHDLLGSWVGRISRIWDLFSPMP